MQKLDANPNLFKKNIICNETWIFCYDPERVNILENTDNEKKLVEASISTSIKSSSCILFYFKGIWVPEFATMNQHYYKEIWKRWDRVRKKNYQHCWKMVSFFIRKLSLYVHTALSYQYKTHYYTETFSILALGDIFLFLNVKSVVKEEILSQLMQ